MSDSFRDPSVASDNAVACARYFVILLSSSKRTARNTPIEQLRKTKLQNNKPYKQSYFTSKKIPKDAIAYACSAKQGPQYIFIHFRGRSSAVGPANRESLYIRWFSISLSRAVVLARWCSLMMRRVAQGSSSSSRQDWLSFTRYMALRAP